jgi:hypothetical protein
VLLASFVLATFMAGCYLPPPEKMEIPDHSIGPISSDAFPGLVNDAIPPELGKIHVFGYAHWHGFSDSSKSLHFTDPFFTGVAALTDIDILLLLWNEDVQQYQIVEQVPYSEIRFQPRDEWRSTGYLTILMDEPEISIGAQRYTSREKTYLGFVLPSGLRIEREKNKQAHALFEEKVERYIPGQSTNTIPDDY